MKYYLSPKRVNRNGLPKNYTHIAFWNGMFQEDFYEFFESFGRDNYTAFQCIPLDEAELNFIRVTMERTNEERIFEKTITIHKIAVRKCINRRW